MTDSRRILIRRIFGILIVITALLEIFASFRGPLAFVRKPTLVLSPIHAPSLDTDEIAGIRVHLEQALAAGGNHALYPKSLIENFYLERDNATDVFDGSYRGRTDAFELGEALGVERIAIASIQVYREKATVNLTIHNISTEQVVVRSRIEFTGIEGLLDWNDSDGNPVDLSEDIGTTVPGMSVGAWLLLFWLVSLILVSLFPVAGRRAPQVFIEGLMGAGLLLSLFSWIYALNGDMDYVQRFVATSGALDIADTAAERRATLLRYLIPMFLLTSLWILDIGRRMSQWRSSGASGTAAAFVETTAPLWASLSAVLYALSLPNFLVLEGLPILAWTATAPLYLALRKATWGRASGLVILFIGLQSLLINWWQGTFSYVSLPFTVGLTLVQSLPFVLLLTVTLRLLPRTGLMAAPLLWVVFDWYRSLGFLGYPWGLLGVSQYGHPGLIQIASFGGVWMVSFLTHLSGSAIAAGLEGLLDGLVDPALVIHDRWDAVFGGGRKGQIFTAFRTGTAYFIRPWQPLLAVGALVLLVSLWGGLTIRGRDRQMEAAASAGLIRNLKILLVQQNTDPRKHDYHLSFAELSRLTEEGLRENGSFDLVAWPESGFVPDVRFWLDEGRAKRRRGILVQNFLDWQNKLGLPLVTGTQDHFYEFVQPPEQEGSSGPESRNPDSSNPVKESDGPVEVKRIRNSAMYLGADRLSNMDRDYYYKMRLVPFTENFPFGEQFPWVAELLHNFSTTQWTPGLEHRVLEAPAFSFSTPICFEDVFPDHVRRFVLAGAEVLVNMSNDYWANTPLEGYQHASHAVFRAVENRRPLVRATCSGWTISVDSEGRIAGGWPPFYEPGWIAADIQIPADPDLSFYSRHGDWFPLVSAGLWFLLAAGELILLRRRDRV